MDHPHSGVIGVVRHRSIDPAIESEVHYSSPRPMELFHLSDGFPPGASCARCRDLRPELAGSLPANRVGPQLPNPEARAEKSKSFIEVKIPLRDSTR